MSLGDMVSGEEKEPVVGFCSLLQMSGRLLQLGILDQMVLVPAQYLHSKIGQ